MANAIKQISIQRGYDVTHYVLNCFGGAGGQHACRVADALGMTKVLVHPFAGVLSAFGMGLADIRALRECAIEAELTAESLARLDGTFARLAAEAGGEVGAQGVRRDGDPADPAAAPALPGDRYRADRRRRAAARRRGSLRTAAPAALRLRDGRPAADYRGVERRGDRRDRPDRRGAGGAAADGAADAARERARVVRGRVAACSVARPRLAGTGRRRRRAGDHRRSQRHHRRRARLAGGNDRPARSAAQPGGGAANSGSDRHPRRSGDARGVQQPVHVDRREHGGGPRQHRPVGEHQGTAGFFLCGVRSRRRPGRQRAAPAGASRLDGRERAGGAARPRRRDAARRCLHAQRPLQRRHAPARHHRHHPGVRRGGAPDPVLRRLARPPCRHRRHPAGIDAARQPNRRRGGNPVRQR